MLTIRCEVCGSQTLVKQNGVFICRTCGVGYSLEEVKQKLNSDSIEAESLPLEDLQVAILEILLPLTSCNDIYPHITYLDLSRHLELKGYIIAPRTLGIPLGVISEFCQDNGAPAISVLVVNSETIMPGNGFYGFVTAKASLTDTEKWEFAFAENERVRSYQHWKRIADLAGIDFN